MSIPRLKERLVGSSQAVEKMERTRKPVTGSGLTTHGRDPICGPSVQHSVSGTEGLPLPTTRPLIPLLYSDNNFILASIYELRHASISSEGLPPL